VSFPVSVALVVIWGVLRLGIFRILLFPLTYTLPLLVGVWARDKVLLWSMAAAFVVMHTVHQLALLPAGVLREPGDTPTYVATLLSIVVGAVVVHVIIVMRDRLDVSLASVHGQAEEMERQNEELTQQSEELTQQNEEMSQQAEELSQQAEELSRQNEELQVQAGKIHALNVELGRREDLLQSLLDAARLAASERAALHDVCTAALDMFGPPADAVVVYEKRSDRLVIRTSAGLATELPDSFPAEHRFTQLVVEQNRTASLNDASLRPDLSILAIAGRPPFQSVLAAPMQAGGRAFGAVVIYGKHPVEWTAEQFRLAEWLAVQCARILDILRLQDDLRRQADLLDLTPDAIIVRRVDGTITLWGHGAEMLYGWTKAEAIGQKTHGLLKTRFPEELGQLTRQLERTGRWSGELVQATKDGREVTVESRWLAERDAAGRIVELLESNVDVTERKRALEALRESDRRKSEFLATLSHELRNPLAPIRYALELLRCENDDGSPAHPKRVIERQLGHLVHLVDDLLDVTRIASNKIRLRRRRVGLADVVQHAVEATTPDIEQANHSLVVSLPADPLWIDADPDRLAQVLTNLLNNAVRYTPNGGRLTLTAAAVQDEVTISVSDTGVGLKSEDRERVFEMFTQVGEPGQGGLGIGLALVKGLVELHGGRIEVRSDGPGRGSEFLIRLPLVAAPSSSAAADAAATGARGTGRRVLVVDDNVDSAEMLKTFLELHGHDVRVANDGASALAMMPEFVPDIGLFDIGLPGMSGYDLARHIREDGRYGGIFLVAVTGWGQEEDRQRARECGFNAHLTKPADPADLHRVLAQRGDGEENGI
jgi:PAS domain S-box-containing protein